MSLKNLGFTIAFSGGITWDPTYLALDFDDEEGGSLSLAHLELTANAFIPKTPAGLIDAGGVTITYLADPDIPPPLHTVGTLTVTFPLPVPAGGLITPANISGTGFFDSRTDPQVSNILDGQTEIMVATGHFVWDAGTGPTRTDAA